jgi:hypothetical protein
LSASSLEAALSWRHERVHVVCDPRVGLHAIIARTGSAPTGSSRASP